MNKASTTPTKNTNVGMLLLNTSSNMITCRKPTPLT